MTHTDLIREARQRAALLAETGGPTTYLLDRLLYRLVAALEATSAPQEPEPTPADTPAPDTTPAPATTEHGTRETTPAVERAAEVVYDRHTTNIAAEFDDISDESRDRYIETARAVLDAALDDTYGLARLIYEMERPEATWPPSSTFTWGKYLARADVIRAHLLGGAR